VKMPSYYSFADKTGKTGKTMSWWPTSEKSIKRWNSL
jgi:hypothetical protein